MSTAAFVARSAGLTCKALLAWTLSAHTVSAADLVITNARVFTAADSAVLERANIAVTGGRIEAISTEAIDTAGAKVIDAQGMTAMPGLIDAHIHTFFKLPPPGGTSPAKPWFPQSEAEARAYINGELREKLAALLQHGFTSILSSIDFWPLIVEVRERLAHGELKGPRLFVSGGGFGAPKPHPFCGGNAWCAEHISVPTGGPEQARDWVRRYAESGVDHIVMVNVPQPKPLSPEFITAVTDEAHRRKLRVFLESPINAADVPNLVQWGVDGFLHPPGVVLDQDGTLLASAGRKRLPVAITLGVTEERHRLSPQVSPAELEKYEILRGNTLALLKAGATPVFGSDLGDKSGVSPDDMIRIEVRSLAGLGLTPTQVLHAATRDAARSMLGREDLGTLEPGKTADVIIVDGDPLKDLEALTRVVVVVKEGTVVADHRADHRNRSAEAAAAAQVMVTPASIVWESAPGLPPGAKRALLVGDPARFGPFVVRMQFPAGIRLAPHWHTSGENVTVLSGTIAVGVGDTFDEAAMRDVPAGSFYFAPPNTHHYLMTKTAVTSQVHGTGPVDRVFVNPADDPRNQAK